MRIVAGVLGRRLPVGREEESVAHLANKRCNLLGISSSRPILASMVHARDRGVRAPAATACGGRPRDAVLAATGPPETTVPCPFTFALDRGCSHTFEWAGTRARCAWRKCAAGVSCVRGNGIDRGSSIAVAGPAGRCGPRELRDNVK
jgi:hypothetical protein